MKALQRYENNNLAINIVLFKEKSQIYGVTIDNFNFCRERSHKSFLQIGMQFLNLTCR